MCIQAAFECKHQPIIFCSVCCVMKLRSMQEAIEGIDQLAIYGTL